MVKATELQKTIKPSPKWSKHATCALATFAQNGNSKTTNRKTSKEKKMKKKTGGLWKSEAAKKQLS